MTIEKDRGNLGEIVFATRVVASGLDPRRARQIVLLLAASVALMMTGFGIVLPVFARRLSELGSGVEVMGLMTMSFALAQLVSAPFMGSLADRIGRRPIVIWSLAAFALTNIGLLLAQTVEVFIAVRTLEGALTAGLFPAALGIVADTVPEDERARWVGIVMGSYAAGFIFGPVAGGLLYDSLGFSAPFLASAVLAAIACIAAAILVPETRTAAVRWREKLRKRRQPTAALAPLTSMWRSLPRPLVLFGALLMLDFTLVFAFAFVEPEMVFYLYEELGWTTSQFGFVIAAYGLAIVISQAVLGGLSDRFGRKPIIVLGFLVSAVFYAGLAVFTRFPMMMLVALIAGIGEGVALPALSAFYLDITTEQHRSRIMGIKESAAALGGVAGPLVVVLLSAVTTPQIVFLSACILIVVATGLAVVVLSGQRSIEDHAAGTVLEYTSRRHTAAQASLRGIVLRAATSRETRGAAH